jgi:hypothetical protein
MELMDILHCAIILIAIYVSVSILKNEKRSGISPTPTMPNVRQVVIDMINTHADHSHEFKVGELGCGWGGLALKIVNVFPLASVVGYEISPCPLLMSRVRALLVKRLAIRNSDFFAADWSQFDVIVCYLSPQHMVKIKEKLAGMTKKPLFISCSFEMAGVVPIETKTLNKLFPVSVYAYR